MEKVLIITISTLIFFGLNSFTTSNNPFEDLMGTWHPSVYKDGYPVEYIRGGTLEEYNNFFGKGAMKFLENGAVIVRVRAGLCGTGPISYSNFPGTWEFLSDSTLRINYPSNFLGRRVVEWQIVELSSDKLKVKVLFNRFIESNRNKRF
jgi:hypothetical protein